MSLSARIVACLILVGALVAAVWALVVRVDAAGYGRCQAEHAGAALNQSLDFRAEEHQGAISAVENHSEDRKALEAAQRDALGARTERDRLLNLLAERERAASSAGSDPQRSDAAGERESLGACAGDFEGMAGEADRLALKVNALQGAIQASCPAALATHSSDEASK